MAKTLSNIQLSDTNETFEQDVYVNRPLNKVFLYIYGERPTVWNIRATPDTRIIGIIAGGHHPQMVRGIGNDETFINIKGCHEDKSWIIGRLRYNIRDLGLLNAHYVNNGGNAVVGDKLSDPYYRFDADKMTGHALELDLLPNKLGLTQLIERGIYIMDQTLDEWK